MSTWVKNVFNGSTLTFDGAPVAALEDVEWHVGGQKVDVGSIDDLLMLYGQGQDDVDVSATVKGTTALARGDQGELAVEWNSDEDPTPLANAAVNDLATSGGKNAPITTKIQFCPAPEES